LETSEAWCSSCSSIGAVSRSILVVLDSDFVAGVLADQNPVAGLHLLNGMLRRCPVHSS
jgi:hypothetical protein